MQWVASLTKTMLPGQKTQVLVNAETEEAAKLLAGMQLGVAPSAVRVEALSGQRT